jgi:hypothetical protein
MEEEKKKKKEKIMLYFFKTDPSPHASFSLNSNEGLLLSELWI